MMARGALVVRLADGMPGRILACPTETKALAEFSGARQWVGLADVELVMGLVVQHFADCPRRRHREGRVRGAA